jgi:hypothetical protein
VIAAASIKPYGAFRFRYYPKIAVPRYNVSRGGLIVSHATRASTATQGCGSIGRCAQYIGGIESIVLRRERRVARSVHSPRLLVRYDLVTIFASDNDIGDLRTRTLTALPQA